ncbi:MAG TPA: apolipoprotein N-acyltransferase [Sphingomicrobium sp.]|nr:apolipoprotein N-acyltransferase [Sphingomicrobium sp.]
MTMLFALALLTGVLSALAFEPLGLWVLMPVAFAALLWMLWRAERLWQALLVGWLFGFGQFAVSLNWIATAFTFQSAMPPWLGWVAVLLVSLYLAVYPALAAGLAWRIGRDNEVAMVLALAGAWAVTEWLRAGIFTGFAWNPAAAAMTPTALITLTALIGTYGLSALTVLLGSVIWLEVRRKWLPGVVIVLATAILWLLPSSPVPEDPLLLRPIRIVQPNIGQEDKWRPGFAEESARRLAALSTKDSERHAPRLLFWPEAAVTEPLADTRNGPPQSMAAFERARAAASLQPGEFLLTGGLGLTSDDGRSIGGATNSVFVLAPGGKIVGRYDKAHLVPYGEYLPMRPLLSKLGLSRLAPGEIDFDPGPGPKTIYLPRWGRVGLQICYEIIFSGHVVDWQHRPDFIFNPSNDAWFGSWGPPQHLAQARLRAAEEGLPIIRATPTGISALIDARGNVVEQLGWHKAGVIDAYLPPPSAQPTPFARFGNAIPLLLAAAMLIAAIALAGARRYRRT